MMLPIAVAMGGAIGSLLRYTLMSLFQNIYSFPIGTLGVNVIGAFLAGLLMKLVGSLSIEIRNFIFMGVLGGFTTFSAFIMDVWQFFNKGEVVLGSVYIVLSLALSLLAFILGMRILA